VRLWQCLHANLFTSIETLNAAKHFEAAKRERPELRRFTDLAGVLDFLHARDGNPETKDRILAAFDAYAEVGITAIMPMPGLCRGRLVSF
jgi:hypothetical protein